MNPKKYNRIANGCLVIAILSALSFESLGWWAGSVGILAAITATWLYFHNLHQTDEQNLKL